MRIFHFIKYDELTSPEHLLSLAKGDTILCLDLEDSIQDCVIPENTPQLKNHFRKCFISILGKFNSLHADIKIGVRINDAASIEYLKDIDALAEAGYISVIFLPKTKNAGQILDLQQRLMKKGVAYDEIIPVIESKTGMNNLEKIVNNPACKMQSVAFGHCDYNLDNDIYPFFHQDSREYWTWITKIITILKPHQINLVNSPYLQLHNDSFFKEMLSVLHALGGKDVGQIVLNRAQSNICNAYQGRKGDYCSYRINHTLDLRVPDSYANDFINAFEINRGHHGFAINENGILLSPQEYQASLSYRNKKNYLPEINFAFAGGCFPVQGDILFEDLFHQHVRRRIEAAQKIKFNVNIIRYEQFANTLNRISKFKDKHPIDILALSIRPEPFLRLVKLYYRFYDPVSHRKKWSLNLPLLKMINPEKFDLLALNTGFPSKGMFNGSFIRRCFRNLNYWIGTMLGNEKYAWKQYEKLVKEVMFYCKQKDIQLIIVGPPVVSRSGINSILCKRLVHHVKRLVFTSGVHFVDGTAGKKNDASWFDKNGIYAREQYHELLADRLYQVLTELIISSEDYTIQHGMTTFNFHLRSPHPASATGFT